MWFLFVGRIRVKTQKLESTTTRFFFVRKGWATFCWKGWDSKIGTRLDGPLLVGRAAIERSNAKRKSVGEITFSLLECPWETQLYESKKRERSSRTDGRSYILL